MKSTLKKFQKIMMAATFAEAGEWETAREMTPPLELSRRQTWLDRIFTAVTFAEAGLRNEAIGCLTPARVKNECTSIFTDEIGLKGVRLVYGTVTI